ncbi:MAG: sulfite exporter TauE/SafE family protein [Abditibacteriota bacterium]|nr:sulfite exporter TauE/SafE family protein [Abditibacteriota bacterium]
MRLRIFVVALILCASALSAGRVTVTDGSFFGGKLTLKVSVEKGCHIDPQGYPISVLVNGKKCDKVSLPTGKELSGDFEVVCDVAGEVPVPAKIALDAQPCEDKMCFPPERAEFTVEKKSESSSVTIWGAFLLGLLVSLSPCVYPMIPITVGFFAAGGKSSRRERGLKALLYLLGLAVSASLIGTAAAFAGSVFGVQMQNPYVSLAIALVLAALALSMFGVYSLNAPAKLQGLVRGRSGYAGAGVMGLVAGVVASPCAAPALVAVAAVAAVSGSLLKGFSLMFAFALGEGMILFLLALFSASIPAPGEWMERVRKVCGALMLAAAAWFAAPIFGVDGAAAALGVFGLALCVLAFKNGVGFAFVGFAALLGCVVMIGRAGAAESAVNWVPYTENIPVGKPVIIDFTADWCSVCKETEKKVFADEEVGKTCEGVVCMRMDGSARTEAVEAAEKRFDVMGYPTIIFIGPDGKERTELRVVGGIGKGGFADRVKALKE